MQNNDWSDEHKTKADDCGQTTKRHSTSHTTQDLC